MRYLRGFIPTPRTPPKALFTPYKDQVLHLSHLRKRLCEEVRRDAFNLILVSSILQVVTDFQQFLRDTLRRHLSLHGDAPLQPPKSSCRAVKACINCVQAKQRCFGSSPCDRCNRRNLHCRFADSSSKSTTEATRLSEDGTSPSGGSALQQPSDCNGLFTNVPPLPTDLSPVNLQPSEPFEFLHETRAVDPLSIFGSMVEPLLLWPLDGAEMNVYDQMLPNPEPSSDNIDLNFSLSTTFQSKDSGKNCNLVPTPPVTRNFAAGVGEALTSNPESANFPGTQISNSIDSDSYGGELELTGPERDLLTSEDYVHVPKIDTSKHQSLLRFCAELFQDILETSRPRLPSREILNTFIQLYFEHFHNGFPLLHKGTFEPQKQPPILLFAIAALGSHYSRLPCREAVRFTLLRIIRHVNLSAVCQFSITLSWFIEHG